jgi:type 1 glutamine amidotransferase
MGRLFLGLALVGVMAQGVCWAADGGQQSAQIKVLLIAGDDVAPYHDWREISEKTREVLAGSDRFDVKVCEDPLILDSDAALKNYDVIVMTMFHRGTPKMTDQAKENLLNFVKGGKGLYLQHLASASFPDWAEFGKMCGRVWVMGTSGHGPRSVFDAKIVKKDYPITQGMKDFKIFDELYSKLQGDGPIEVLVSAYSDWSKQEEPLVFTTSYGKGRCVQNAFGHDFKAILNPSMQQLIRRGVEWAATGKVQ